jgi:uncharacterized protein
MKIVLLALLLVLSGTPGVAQDNAATVRAAIDEHILPRIGALAARTDALAAAAAAGCAPTSPDLRAAFADAFDAWVGVSHLRFGPMETDNRGFALAFWPDARGATERSLAAMIAEEDPAVRDPAEFATVSVAARGFYALEMTLYDDAIGASADAGYLCDLIDAQARDIAATAAAIDADWRDDYADLMREPGNDTYRSPDEALRELYTALGTGLQFTSDTRLGLPLGSFDRPRPTLAEARRSGRSLRHVTLSLRSLRELASILAAGTPDAGGALDAAFARALGLSAALGDPDFSELSDPQARLRVEVLQQQVDRIRTVGAAGLGPALGVAEGFNAMDGD